MGNLGVVIVLFYGFYCEWWMWREYCEILKDIYGDLLQNYVIYFCRGYSVGFLGCGYYCIWGIAQGFYGYRCRLLINCFERNWGRGYRFQYFKDVCGVGLWVIL